MVGVFRNLIQLIIPTRNSLLNRLHDLNAHFSISVWENLDKKSDVAKEYHCIKIYTYPIVHGLIFIILKHKKHIGMH